MSDLQPRAEVRSQKALLKAQLEYLVQQDKTENPAIYDSKRSESSSRALLSPFLAVLPYFAFVELPSTFGVSTGASVWAWGIGLLPFAVFAARFANVDRLTYQQRHDAATVNEMREKEQDLLGSSSS